MPIEHLPNTATADEIAAVLARDGCAVVDQLVSRGEVETARRA